MLNQKTTPSPEQGVSCLLQKDKQHLNIIRLFESFHINFKSDSPLCLLMEYAPVIFFIYKSEFQNELNENQHYQ